MLGGTTRQASLRAVPVSGQRYSTRVRAIRAATWTLKKLRLRRLVWDARKAQIRRRRRREEAQGSDRLSHPALHGVDEILNRLIDKDGGFFVEAGANDGYMQSNTYWLARFRGWRGVLIEAMPDIAREAAQERPESAVEHCALVADDYPDATIEMRSGDLMSMVHGIGAPTGADEEDWAWIGIVHGWRDPGVFRVPARTLTSVLAEHDVPEIDLLSLDVEGYEPFVLRGLDLDRFAPRWICVEAHPEVGHEAIAEILGDRYVFHGRISPIDVVFRRADVSAPAASG
jgi:FkbM family methyltransferase